MSHRLKRVVQLVLWLLACLILLQSGVGLMLNHSKGLDLEQRYISSNWLMSHYGIGSAEADVSFLVDNKIISQFDTQLFVDAEPITHVDRPLVGAIMLDALMVLATDQALILLSPEGEYVETMGAEAGVPAPIQNIGTYHGEPVLQARNGMWRSNFMLDIWEPMSLQGVSWSRPHPMPDSVAEELKTFFYGKGVTVEQLLIDIHNGRILGTAGIWLIDILGILLVVLSFTGLWMWGRRL
jgi:hypothetical protein